MNDYFMSATGDYIVHRLFELQDSDYRDFHAKLIPNVSKDTIIGVRTPALRKLAKELFRELCVGGTYDLKEFVDALPHKYYEENNLHGFFIEQIKDYDKCIEALDIFLPYVDNWATCDLMSPKIFKKNTDKLFAKIKDWLKSDKTYVVRFGIECLMKYYLDGKFNPEINELVIAVKSDEYYINMMIAWYFATALAKQYEASIPVLEELRLPAWIHNKTIQKAVESYRISDETKKYLKSLRVSKV